MVVERIHISCQSSNYIQVQLTHSAYWTTSMSAIILYSIYFRTLWDQGSRFCANTAMEQISPEPNPLKTHGSPRIFLGTSPYIHTRFYTLVCRPDNIIWMYRLNTDYFLNYCMKLTVCPLFPGLFPRPKMPEMFRISLCFILTFTFYSQNTSCVNNCIALRTILVSCLGCSFLWEAK